MADFDRAVQVVIANEDGYVNDPDDPGGETKYGISKASYPNIDIKALTVAQAEQIYERDFWNELYAQIDSQDIATKLLDTAVLCGTGPAVKMLQESFSHFVDGYLQIDGSFGPATLSAVNKIVPSKLLQEYRARIAEHHAKTVLANPKLAKFLLGWIRRAIQ